MTIFRQDVLEAVYACGRCSLCDITELLYGVPTVAECGRVDRACAWLIRYGYVRKRGSLNITGKGVEELHKCNLL